MTFRKVHLWILPPFSRSLNFHNARAKKELWYSCVKSFKVHFPKGVSQLKRSNILIWVLLFNYQVQTNWDFWWIENYISVRWWFLGRQMSIIYEYEWFYPIQGGPERMQQLLLLISWTSSMKQNCFVFHLVEHQFSNKMTPWSLVLGKVSGL